VSQSLTGGWLELFLGLAPTSAPKSSALSFRSAFFLRRVELRGNFLPTILKADFRAPCGLSRLRGLWWRATIQSRIRSTRTPSTVANCPGTKCRAQAVEQLSLKTIRLRTKSTVFTNHELRFALKSLAADTERIEPDTAAPVLFGISRHPWREPAPLGDAIDEAECDTDATVWQRLWTRRHGEILGRAGIAGDR